MKERMALRKALINPGDLVKLVKLHRKLRILDCSWHMPNSGLSGRKRFMEERIPSAHFFDIDECSDKKSKYDHMLPSKHQFADYCGSILGIDNRTSIIVYDNIPGFPFLSAQRVWWMFRVFGHADVTILDGGMHAWREMSLGTSAAVDDPYIAPRKVFFEPANSPRSDLIKRFEMVTRNIKNEKFQLVDARAAPRYDGTASEPRPEILPGHVPGAKNIPFTEFLDLKKMRMKKPAELKKIFAKNSVDLTKPVVASCGTGITGCHVALAAYLCGVENVAVYDGSWVEYFQRASHEQLESVPWPK